MKKAVKMMLSSDEKERARGMTKLAKIRSELVSELSAVIADLHNHVYRPRAVSEAMWTLGVLRDPRGVKVLVDYIGFPIQKHPDAGEYPGPYLSNADHFKSFPELCPAVRMLVFIGDPCVDQVIKKLSTTDSAVEMQNCIAVLQMLEQRPSVREKLEGVMKDGSPRHPEFLKKAVESLDKRPKSSER